MFEVKTTKYFSIYQPYINSGLILEDSFSKLKREVYKNLVGWFYIIYIRKDKHFDFSSKNALPLIYKYFHKYLWFYTDPFKFFIEKIVARR